MSPCIWSQLCFCPNCESTTECAFASKSEHGDIRPFLCSTTTAWRSVVGRDATSFALPNDRSRRTGFAATLGSVGRRRLIAKDRGAGTTRARSRRILSAWRTRLRQAARNNGNWAGRQWSLPEPGIINSDGLD